MTATAERTTTGEIDVHGFIQANYTPYDGDRRPCQVGSYGSEQAAQAEAP
jgi:hypothetical protein